MLKFFRTMFRVRPKRELRELYLFLFFFAFAGSLVAIFLPVFLLQLGFSLSGIAFYYAIHYTIYVVLMPLGAQFAARFGYERSLAMSTPILIVHFLLLSQLPNYPSLFWIAPGILALHKIFYWPAYHANFATFSDAGNRGTEQSWVRLIAFSSGIVGPTLGGFVALRFGFSALFIVAAASLVLAVLVMLRTDEHQAEADFPYASPWQFLRRPTQRRLIVAMIGWGENLIHMVYWPIFLFTVFQNTAQLGLVISAATALAMALGFGIGELSDRLSARRVLRSAAPFLSATYLARIFFAGAPVGAAVASGYNQVAQSGYQIPFISRLNRNAKQSRQPLVYAVAFEMTLAIVKGLLAWLLVIVLPVVGLAEGFILLWVIAGLLALFYAAL